MARFGKYLFLGFCLAFAGGAPAYAGLIISPTFDSSITSDANAGSIEATINAAIAIYENTYTNPINVSIEFQEGGGLGSSAFNLFLVTYSDFRARLAANEALTGQADQITALAGLPAGPNNPVTGTTDMLIKSANAKALGFTGLPPGFDGTITLNTSLMTPGSPGSTNQYSLQAVAEHEIDEILGLGSTLGLGLSSPYNNDPSPEDLYRYTSSGARTFTTSGDNAYFSINGGATLLARFNQNSGGDYGDWWSTGSHTPQVQDAFGTPGANPSLRVELTALDVIGYDRAPEPATGVLLVAALAVLGGLKKRL